MTERRRGPKGTEDNVSDDLAKTQRDRSERDASGEAVEEEGQPGGGGVKDNVKDEWDESQRH